MYIRILYLIVSLSLLSFFNLGCVSTYYGQKNTYELESNGKKTTNMEMLVASSQDYGVSIVSDCDRETIYSFMISPLIPFPPIIPAWNWNDEDKSKLIVVLFGDNFQFYGTKISIHKEGKSSYADLNYFYVKRTPMQIHFDAPGCSFLNNATILIEGLKYNGMLIDIPEIYMKYRNEGSFMDFYYMR